MHTCALTDAAKQGFERAADRRIPSVSRETLGSPALLSLTMKAFVPIKQRVAFAPGVNGPRQLMRQDAQRFALAMRVVPSGQMLLPCRMMA
jgi:hypothetical protein